MLTQIIKGEKFIPIKFHGNVKHLVFACNVCGKEFVKPESYFKKQSKMRKHACCFCSPKCRSQYLYQHKDEFRNSAEPVQPVSEQIKENPVVAQPVTAEVKPASPEKTDTVVTPPPAPAPESVAAAPAPHKKGGVFSNFLRGLLTPKN